MVSVIGLVGIVCVGVMMWLIRFLMVVIWIGLSAVMVSGGLFIVFV